MTGVSNKRKRRISSSPAASPVHSQRRTRRCTKSVNYTEPSSSFESPSQPPSTNPSEEASQQSHSSSYASSASFAVRAILDERLSAHGHEYLIDWENDPNTNQSFSPTWELVANLSAPEKEREFLLRKGRHLNGPSSHEIFDEANIKAIFVSSPKSSPTSPSHRNIRHREQSGSKHLARGSKLSPVAAHTAVSTHRCQPTGRRLLFNPGKCQDSAWLPFKLISSAHFIHKPLHLTLILSQSINSTTPPHSPLSGDSGEGHSLIPRAKHHLRTLNAPPRKFPTIIPDSQPSVQPDTVARITSLISIEAPSHQVCKFSICSSH
jgi:hypothetical protein